MKNHCKMRSRGLSHGLTILYCYENFFICLYVLWRLFCVFRLLKSNHFQLYVNATPYCKNAGIRYTNYFHMWSSVFLLTSHAQNIPPWKPMWHGEEYTWISKILALRTGSFKHMHAHTYYIKRLVFHLQCMFSLSHPLLTSARVLTCFFSTMWNFFRLMWHVTFIKQTY